MARQNSTIENSEGRSTTHAAGPYADNIIELRGGQVDQICPMLATTGLRDEKLLVRRVKNLTKRASLLKIDAGRWNSNSTELTGRIILTVAVGLREHSRFPSIRKTRLRR